ncbi:hypothetical protein LVIS_1900 [Levilactobacillus brevis ATCC 367]|uniref:Uncharacterized protein n=1 Tax=Levilactobacillus brevis (strain ATCC 367 / BCRC 12310 / CIP 105137 / JCM 1170 / LMG 11437 / NCIMB 947 / NCTC 947) TaxID=387344 RepID=Q03PB2_LEVBA|nr:hypothetical protein LVIS_1900 [Levilactobacillus brevis ATCC 367]
MLLGVSVMLRAIGKLAIDLAKAYLIYKKATSIKK